jgi:hypothetical protein
VRLSGLVKSIFPPDTLWLAPRSRINDNPPPDKGPQFPAKQRLNRALGRRAHPIQNHFLVAQLLVVSNGV